jgi:pilus assembly protein Flp/PilA
VVNEAFNHSFARFGKEDEVLQNNAELEPQAEPANERGATATEYALLVGLIALIIVVGVGAFGGALNTWFNTLATTVAGW